MKIAFTTIALFAAATAFAGIPASQSPLDFGVSVGALSSKVFRVKAGKIEYAVIAADFGEPACNSVQTIVTVTDEAIGGEDPSITYNLGTQVTGITSVRAKGDQVVIAASVSKPEDCLKTLPKTFTIQYKGQKSDLNFSAK